MGGSGSGQRGAHACLVVGSTTPVAVGGGCGWLGHNVVVGRVVSLRRALQLVA